MWIAPAIGLARKPAGTGRTFWTFCSMSALASRLSATFVATVCCTFGSLARGATVDTNVSVLSSSLRV